MTVPEGDRMASPLLRFWFLTAGRAEVWWPAV